MRNFLGRKDIQFWGALATIIALFIAILAWLFPNPFNDVTNSPLTPIPTATITSDNANILPVKGDVIETDKLYFPWTKLLTIIFKNLPFETWKFLSITLCIAGIVFGAIIYFKGILSNSESRIGVIIILMVLSFWLSIAKWGWRGVLIGFGIYALFFIGVNVNFIFGAMLGLVSGGIAGVGIALMVNAFSGVFIESYLVSGNIIGSVVGIVLGAIVGNFIEYDSLLG